MMPKNDDKMLVEQLEDLLDDYSYKCEELERVRCLTHRARCYLELILIQQELQLVTDKLEADDVTRYLWGIAQDILARDQAQFHREAVRLLAESCEELHTIIGHAVRELSSSARSTATNHERTQHANDRTE